MEISNSFRERDFNVGLFLFLSTSTTKQRINNIVSAFSYHRDEEREKKKSTQYFFIVVFNYDPSLSFCIVLKSI